MSAKEADLGTGRTGGRDATTGVIPGRFALSVGLPDTAPPKGWKWTSLSSVAQLESGHTPSRKHPEYWDGEVPWIGIKDATENHGRTIYDTYQHVTELGLANSSARVLPANTICLSRTASVGFVVRMGRPMATSQDFVNWVCGPNVDAHFLKYVLVAEKEALWRFASGTTHQTIYYPEAKAFHVCLPPLPEQKAIAVILGALDDKIELNRRMNTTLEVMARALFQSWFVDFDPVRAKLDGRPPAALDPATAALFPAHFQESPLGHIPQGWAVKSLSEITTLITKGTTPTQEDITNAADDDAQINYVRVNSIEEDGSIIYDKLTKIPLSVHAGVLKRSVLQANDVLYTIAGTIGRIATAEDWVLPANTNQAVAIIRPNPTIPSSFLVLTMRHDVFREELHNNIVHAVQANLSLGMLSKARAVVPPEDVLLKIFKPIDDIMSQISANRAQSRTLATMRDALLPRLLSGELRVSEADSSIEVYA